MSFGVTKLDWLLLAICLVLALPRLALGEPLLGLLEQQFVRFARNRRAAIAAIGVIAILARLALLLWIPTPQPKVHDEFSYLLAADTFLHGRLANPPHPLWIFFDTFHVIQHPTYAAIYPPAQGAVLALGRLLGHPWIGVLLSMAATCMAVTWMLQGWLPEEWALLGGALVVSRFALFNYWINSYWGGAVAAAGAAVVLGALPRIWESQRPRDAILLGLGAGILATSRPFEGFLFFLPVGGALLWWYFRQERAVRLRSRRRVLLPLAAVLGCAAAFIAYYNWRITANPLLFPHLIEIRTLITTPLFVWQHAKPPLTYANPQFDDFYNNFLPSLYQTGWQDAKELAEEKSAEFWQFFLGPALSVPILLALPWLLADRKLRVLWIQLGLVAMGLLTLAWFEVHYAAPLLATVMVLVMTGMRRVRQFRIGRWPVGVGITRLVVLFSFCIGPAYFVNTAMSRSDSFSDAWNSARGWLDGHRWLLLATTLMAIGLVRLLAMRANATSGPRRAAPAYLELVFLTLAMVQIAAAQGRFHPDDYPFDDDWDESARAPIERYLAAMPGEHLVLVRYAPEHFVHNEFVYNEADIDHAKIVWAREIPARDLSALLAYFRNRKVWVVEPDEDPARIYPYAPRAPTP
jgi:hypothetical protein